MRDSVVAIMISVAEPEILADIRENRSGVFHRLRERDTHLRVQRLEVGDYVVAKGVACERKTLADLRHSWSDGSLIRQCYALRCTFTTPLLIVELGVAGPKATDQAKGIARTLDYLFDSCSIPFSFVGTQDETADLLCSLAQENSHLGPPRAEREPMTVSRVWFIGLAMAVSPSVARALLDDIGSPHEIIHHFVDQEGDHPMVSREDIEFFKEILTSEKEDLDIISPWWSKGAHWLRPERPPKGKDLVLPRWARAVLGDYE